MNVDIVIYQDGNSPFRNWKVNAIRYAPPHRKLFAFIFFHNGRIMFEWLPRLSDIRLMEKMIKLLKEEYDF